MKYSALATATMALLVCGPATAADTIDSTETRATWLDTITVAGTRVETSVKDNPASVSVIDREQIEKQAPTSIAELLRDVPGVTVMDASAPGMQRISIRGESSQRVTILVDGQEITDHSTYGTPILVDPTNVERIEVVRGPASVLYGAKAIGGVINIITRRGASRPIELEVGGSWYSGTKGWQGWSAISGTLGNLDYRLAASADRQGDRRVPTGPYSDTGRLDGSSYHNSDTSLHLGYTLGEERNHYIALKVEQHRLDTDSWTDPSTLTYPITDFSIELPKRDLTKVGLFYDGDNLGPIVRKVHVDAYYQTVDRLFTNRVVMQPTSMINVGVTSTSDDRNINYGGMAQVDLQLHPSHYTIAGVQYLMDDLDTDKTSATSTTIGPRPPTVSSSLLQDRASILTASAFLQDEWSLTDTLKLIGGMRYYHVKASLDETTDPTRAGQNGTTDRLVKSLGLTYTGVSNTTLRTLYSEGYIMPTLLQLYTDTSAGRGSLTYGNSALSPETSRNIEIGARYNHGGLLLDATAYYTQAKNYITSQPCADVSGCPAAAATGSYIYVNADGAHTHGVELLAEYHVPGTSFTPYVSGAWTRRKLKFSGLSTYDSGTPALIGRMGLRHESKLAGAQVWADLFVRASTQLRQTVVSDAVESTQRLPGWGTLNLVLGAARGKEKRQQITLQLNNLFDKGYRPSLDELPATGRNVIVTYQMKF